MGVQALQQTDEGGQLQGERDRRDAVESLSVGYDYRHGVPQFTSDGV